MKIKIKDLTLGQIIQIAKKCDCKCNVCPLNNVFHIKCYEYCYCSQKTKKGIETDLEMEIEVEIDE